MNFPLELIQLKIMANANMKSNPVNNKIDQNGLETIQSQTDSGKEKNLSQLKLSNPVPGFPIPPPPAKPVSPDKNAVNPMLIHFERSKG